VRGAPQLLVKLFTDHLTAHSLESGLKFEARIAI
jgi:hypothetical protein